MLTPTTLTVSTPFYANGNTPAVDLSRGLPQGVDGDILLLGCGDVRSILFTAYCNYNFGKSPEELRRSCLVDSRLL
jgi:hypothetical protein